MNIASANEFCANEEDELQRALELHENLDVINTVVDEYHTIDWKEVRKTK
jgi:hypothetical protein